MAENFVKKTRRLYEALKTYKATEEALWADMSLTEKLANGLIRVRESVKSILRKDDPSQLELLIDGEPLPLDEVDEADLSLLRERGYGLIKDGQSRIKRGNAYLAEYNRRINLKEGT